MCSRVCFERSAERRRGLSAARACETLLRKAPECAWEIRINGEGTAPPSDGVGWAGGKRARLFLVKGRRRRGGEERKEEEGGMSAGDND